MAAEQREGTRWARGAARAQAVLRDARHRARRRWAERAPSRRSAEQPEMAWKQRVEGLDARLAHVEAELEGLQDAVHRQAVRVDEDLEDLRGRLEPERIARELSEDARRRGL